MSSGFNINCFVLISSQVQAAFIFLWSRRLSSLADQWPVSYAAALSSARVVPLSSLDVLDDRVRDVDVDCLFPCAFRIFISIIRGFDAGCGATSSS